MAEDLDKKAEALYQQIISRCRGERKKRTSLTVRSMAQKLGKTENFVSAIENGREQPSMKTFLQYLLVAGFDVKPLSNLSIDPIESNESKLSNKQKGLINQIYDLNEDEVKFLAEQSIVARRVFRKRRNR